MLKSIFQRRGVRLLGIPSINREPTEYYRFSAYLETRFEVAETSAARTKDVGAVGMRTFKRGLFSARYLAAME
jgi:hypothetical protein